MAAEGLKVPLKQPKRGRLWLNDGSIIRLRPEFPKHVWSDDFMEDHTQDGNPFRILNVIDEYTRERLAVKVTRSLTHKDVLELPTQLFCERHVPNAIFTTHRQQVVRSLADQQDLTSCRFNASQEVCRFVQESCS